MKNQLVLDKSYLLGARARDVGELCEANTVFMTEALFFELVGGDSIEASRCFRKFPGGLNPIEALPHTGALLRWEIEQGTSVSPLASQSMDKAWIFNSRLARGTFVLSASQKRGLSEWRGFVEEATHELVRRILGGPMTIKELPSVRGKAFDMTIASARDEVAQNSDSVREFYGAIRPATFPKPEVLTPMWALYRWTQVQLSYVLDYMSRYGPGSIECSESAVMHDLLDLQYLTPALVCGGLATRDKRLAKMFSTLSPGGKLVS